VWQRLAKLLGGIIPREYAANGEKFKQIGRERKGMHKTGCLPLKQAL